MNQSDQMESANIPKLLLKFSLPAIVGLLVNALYNIVDSIFVGQGVGELALAGVTVGLPVVTTFMACIMLIGMGATSLISIRLGERKGQEAEKIVANALVLFLVIGVSLTVVGLIFLKPMLIFFGAGPDILPYAVDYMRIILLGSILFAIGTGMNNFIRAEGNPKTAMNTMLIGTVVNIVLDYVFIFVFKWGIKGAAIATIISYGVTSVWVLHHFIAGNSILKIRIENFKLEKRLVKAIVLIGFPSFILQITGSVQQIILNRSLSRYGGDLALATIGILMSTITFLIMPAMGISQGAQPIIGYNYGAKKYERVKDTLKLSIVAATGIVTLGFVISKIWPVQIISLFNNNPELIKTGTHAMGIFFKFIPLVGMQMISASYFQAVGKPNQATLLGLSRQIIIFIPLLLILPHFWGLEGVWWSGPLSDLGAFVLTGLWLWHEIRALNKIQESSETKVTIFTD
ncbi:MAG: MATE family efflux transporter [Clostridiaceae bacterium]|nr:MATE family efflux transporter [Clostridiaceae bacterium]